MDEYKLRMVLPMKKTLALFCTALLALLCFACGEKPPGPSPDPEQSVALLTLHADKQPLRIVTQKEGVTVTLQMLEYEPTIGFFRPIADKWEEALEPGREYELPGVPTAGIPEYRLLARQGENIAIHLLTSGGDEIIEIEGGLWSPAPIEADSPMVHLARAAVIAPHEEWYDYWYTIANAIATLRGVDLDLAPDELSEEGSAYRVPEWLFEAYAAALFPGKDVPLLEKGESDWVSYHPETHERYWVTQAYSTWIWAEYKSAKQNSDGTWDVTFTVGTTDDDITGEKTVKLAPNAAYNPDSPFEYHIADLSLDGDYDPPNPAPPPPEIVVGAWRAPVKRGHAAWLEIYEDGMAGLYMGDDESDQLYEIYKGTVCPTDDTDIEGSGVDYVMEMEFYLDWHIYESEDGSPVAGVPDSYKGIYTLRQEWEGDQQVLHVVAGIDTDPLFGKEELKMLWMPKTLQDSRMVEIEAVG